MDMREILYIVIPCYNEQEVLKETARRVGAKLSSLIAADTISELSRIVFVNDGSKDATWEIICQLTEESSLFAGIKLSRNRGHQNALLAGLMTVRDATPSPDITISMDADLQDDIDAIEGFIEKYHEGAGIVYGVRNQRKTDAFFKRFTAEGFYKIMRLLGADIVFNHADYRLMSKKALDGLAEFKEVNLFLRGLIPMIGYKTDTVYYARSERFAGESKYPLSKMLSFAFQGISSLSIKPVRIITAMGFIVFGISLLMLIYTFWKHYYGGGTVPGWSSLIVSLWALGGLQLLAIGIVGEYVGKMYMETKQRPRYIVEEIVNL
jgi:glycosyltransferase involved in cell wall biosynthesis